MNDGICARTVGACLAMFATIGMTLPTTNVLTDAPRFFRSALIFSPSARFAMTFWAAAFMAPKDPENVVAASSAATPVKPRSS